MMDVLRGNFETRNKPTFKKSDPTLEEQFEKEALKRLGGSIAFVSRKRLLWSGESGTAATEGAKGE